MSKDFHTETEAWEAQRKQWLTPSSGFDFEKYVKELNATQYRDLADSEKRIGIYKQLIQQSQSFTCPVPLRFIVPVLTTGWEKEGTWSKEIAERDSE